MRVDLIERSDVEHGAQLHPSIRSYFKKYCKSRANGADSAAESEKVLFLQIILLGRANYGEVGATAAATIYRGEPTRYRGGHDISWPLSVTMQGD